MAKPSWGSKHTCPNCNAKFYDLKRKPIICPSCESEVVAQRLLKSRRPVPVENKIPEPKKEVVDDAPEIVEDAAVVDTDDDADDESDVLVLETDDDDEEDVAVVTDTGDEEPDA